MRSFPLFLGFFNKKSLIQTLFSVGFLLVLVNIFDQNSYTREPIPNVDKGLTHSKTKTWTTFDFLLNGELTKNKDAFELKKFEVFPLSGDPTTPLNDSPKVLNDKFEEGEKNLLRIETVEKDGHKKVFFPRLSYPADDYNEYVEKEIPPEVENLYFGPFSFRMNDKTVAINFYFGDRLIKNLPRPLDPPASPRVTSRAKTEKVNAGEAGEWTEEGIEVEWEFKNASEKAPVFAQWYYRQSPSKWELLYIANLSGMKEDLFINPEKLDASFKQVDLRLIYSDGFYQVSEEFPSAAPILKEKTLEVDIWNTVNDEKEYHIDRFVSLELRFFDHENAINGNSPDPRLYDIKWQSDQQTILPEMIHDGRLEYFFLKKGKHTITLTIFYKKKPSLRGQATKVFVVD
jgi:hypothetical protein